MSTVALGPLGEATLAGRTAPSDRIGSRGTPSPLPREPRSMLFVLISTAVSRPVDLQQPALPRPRTLSATAPSAAAPRPAARCPRTLPGSPRRFAAPRRDPIGHVRPTVLGGQQVVDKRGELVDKPRANGSAKARFGAPDHVFGKHAVHASLEHVLALRYGEASGPAECGPPVRRARRQAEVLAPRSMPPCSSCRYRSG